MNEDILSRHAGHTVRHRQGGASALVYNGDDKAITERL